MVDIPQMWCCGSCCSRNTRKTSFLHRNKWQHCWILARPKFSPSRHSQCLGFCSSQSWYELGFHSTSALGPTDYITRGTRVTSSGFCGGLSANEGDGSGVLFSRGISPKASFLSISREVLLTLRPNGDKFNLAVYCTVEGSCSSHG